MFVEVALVAAVACPRYAAGDDLLHAYEGDVLPDSPEGGYLYGACIPPCVPTLGGGHLVLTWPERAQHVNYTKVISQSTNLPPSLWIEWRYRSNHPLGRFLYGCDGQIAVAFGNVFQWLYADGDALVAAGGSRALTGLPFDEFRTIRFEAADSHHFRFHVDGVFFWGREDIQGLLGTYVQFGGHGGCTGDRVPSQRNEWDFVRYGTIAYGEQIVAAEVRMADGESRMANGKPGALRGFLNPVLHAGVDRFTVTYDSPNYVYVDEITVEVTSIDSTVEPPQVLATRRLDNGPSDVVEIVLDRPLPPFARTTFTFDDGVAVNTVEYVTADGDADSDNDRDLADFAAFQNCFACAPDGSPCIMEGGHGPPYDCRIFDLTSDARVDAADFAELATLLTGP